MLKLFLFKNKSQKNSANKYDLSYLSRKFYDSSLLKKLYISLILFFILPLFIIAFIINNQVSRVINKNVCETNLGVLKQTRTSIESVLNDCTYLSTVLLSDDKLQEMAKVYDNKSFTEIENNRYSYNISIQPIMDSRPYISSICISRNSEVVFQFGDRVSVEDTQFHKEAEKLKGIILWTPTYKLKNLINEKSNKSVISLVRAVNDLYEIKQIATERITIDEDYICKLYQSINTDSNGDIFIVDSKGIIISSADKNMLMKNQKDLGYVSDNLNSKEGFYKTKIKNKAYTVFHYSIKSTMWSVVQAIPESNINKQISAINIIIGFCITFCIMFGIIFSIIQNFRIIRPIRFMSREIDKVKSGNFNVGIKIKSNDEIGTLSKSFLDMVENIKDLIDTVYKSKIKERESELIAMEAQINPHFLYNTLDSIRWMAVKNKDYAVGEQIEALADMFRHVLNMGMDMTTIGEEIDHLNNYILIQKSRYGDRINIDIQVEACILVLKTPKLILQPLVENAIHHGLECKVGGGKIWVSIVLQESSVIYTVVDDGLGSDENIIHKMLSEKTEQHKVFALKNINDRIQLKFGKDYGLKYFSKKEEGTTVIVSIPILKNELEVIL